MRIFWKKCKNRLSVGGSASEPPFASGGCMGAPPPDPRIVTLTYYYNLVEALFSAKCALLPS